MTREIVTPAAPAAPIVFCGIARPRQFFAQVRAAGIAPAAEVEFRDHHAYDRRDLKRLLALREKFGAGGFLTTEKDAANLGALQEISSRWRSPGSGSLSTNPLTLWTPFWREPFSQEPGNGSPAREKILSWTDVQHLRI